MLIQTSRLNNVDLNVQVGYCFKLFTFLPHVPVWQIQSLLIPSQLFPSKNLSFLISLMALTSWCMFFIKIMHYAFS